MMSWWWGLTYSIFYTGKKPRGITSWSNTTVYPIGKRNRDISHLSDILLSFTKQRLKEMASLSASASASLLGFRSPSGSGRAQISTTDVLNLKQFASKVSPIPSRFRYFQSVLYFFFFFLKLPPFVYFCSKPSKNTTHEFRTNTVAHS